MTRALCHGLDLSVQIRIRRSHRPRIGGIDAQLLGHLHRALENTIALNQEIRHIGINLRHKDRLGLYIANLGRIGHEGCGPGSDGRSRSRIRTRVANCGHSREFRHDLELIQILLVRNLGNNLERLAGNVVCCHTRKARIDLLAVLQYGIAAVERQLHGLWKLIGQLRKGTSRGLLEETLRLVGEACHELAAILVANLFQERARRQRGIARRERPDIKVDKDELLGIKVVNVGLGVASKNTEVRIDCRVEDAVIGRGKPALLKLHELCDLRDIHRL